MSVVEEGDDAGVVFNGGEVDPGTSIVDALLLLPCTDGFEAADGAGGVGVEVRPLLVARPLANIRIGVTAVAVVLGMISIVLAFVYCQRLHKMFDEVLLQGRYRD